MHANSIHPHQSQNCLDVLHHMLDLAMQTADAASAEKNHKLVLQAVREVTRLVTLINKITSASDKKTAPKPETTLGVLPTVEAQSAGDKRGKNGKTAAPTGLIEQFFKKNKLFNVQGKNFLEAAAANAGANPDNKPAPGAAAAIHWQDDQ
jgi:hypothetical protein